MFFGFCFPFLFSLLKNKNRCSKGICRSDHEKQSQKRFSTLPPPVLSGSGKGFGKSRLSPKAPLYLLYAV
jgi:hypothetical protein